jgi:hypothetical protein
MSDLNGSELTVVAITPILAKEMLDTMVHQRRLRPRVVKRYGEDMKNGRWGFTHQAICIDDQNHLIDGQHRLQAIVDTGLTFPFVVMRGLPEEAAQFFDTGFTRQSTDAAIYAGFGQISAFTLSIARAMLAGLRVSRTIPISNSQLFDFYRRHHKAVHFAAEGRTSRQPRVLVAPVLAVFGRAYYTIPYNELIRAITLLSKGVMPDHQPQARDTTMLMLTRSLMSLPGSGGEATAARYAKTSRALRAFLDGEVLEKIYAATEDLFLLPEEQPSISLGGVGHFDDPRRISRGHNRPPTGTKNS